MQNQKDQTSTVNPEGGTVGKRKNHRQGGKFAGSHTSHFHEASLVLDALAAYELVTKIVLGVIENNGKAAGRPFRVKVVETNDKCLRVTIIKGGHTQQVFVYVAEPCHKAVVQLLAEGFSNQDAGKRAKSARRGRIRRRPPRPSDFNNPTS